MNTQRFRKSRFVMRPLAVVVAASLAACAVGPDYNRPANDLPQNYSSETNGGKIGAASPTIAADWWTLYNDALLNQLVATALEHNVDIRFAAARVEEAQATLREANASFFPEIDLRGNGVRQRIGAAGGTSSSSAGGSSSGGGSSSPRIFNIYQAQLGTSFELDFWGKLRRASESVRASLLATTYAKDVTALSLAGTTVQAYFALRTLDAQIVVTEQTLTAVDDSLKIARQRLTAGYASGLDEAQAETLRAQSALQLREFRRQRAIQQHQIANLTGDLALTIAPGDLEKLPVPTAPPPGLPSTLLERRPDVRAAEQNVVASNALIGVAKAALFPTFSLTGAYGGQSFELSDLLKAPFRVWSIGLGISEPIFAAGRYTARVDEAKARAEQSVASYQKTVETAFKDVADALVNVEETSAAEADVETQVNAARRALRLSKLRYQQGYSAYLDVLDATRTANGAELTLVLNRQARLNYSVDLMKALGGGWHNGATEPGEPHRSDAGIETSSTSQ